MATVLHLTLKKEWFDKIVSGEKTEEYRELKPYWYKRLVHPNGAPLDFDEIYFTNGYGKHRPFVRIKCDKIRAGDRFFNDKIQTVFVIKLGEIIEVGNIE